MFSLSFIHLVFFELSHALSPHLVSECMNMSAMFRSQVKLEYDGQMQDLRRARVRETQAGTWRLRVSDGPPARPLCGSRRSGLPPRRGHPHGYVACAAVSRAHQNRAQGNPFYILDYSDEWFLLCHC